MKFCVVRVAGDMVFQDRFFFRKLKMIFLKEIDNKIYKGLRLCKAELSDYCKVFAFLDGCRNALEKIEFFYPYTEEELKAVLDKGHFMCALDGEEIVATCAVDLDKNYAVQLADVIRSSSGGNVDVDEAYEASGLMVREDHRGAGRSALIRRSRPKRSRLLFPSGTGAVFHADDSAERIPAGSSPPLPLHGLRLPDRLLPA